MDLKVELLSVSCAVEMRLQHNNDTVQTIVEMDLITNDIRKKEAASLSIKIPFKSVVGEDTHHGENNH